METRDQRYLELVTENGTRRVLMFESGRDTGVWALASDDTVGPAGPKVEGAKLFLRFDGARLFVGTQWSEVSAPGVVTAGGVRLSYGVGAAPRDRGEDDDETEVRPPPVGPQLVPPIRTSTPSDFGDDATRIRPSPVMPPVSEPSVSVSFADSAEDATRIRPPPRMPFPVPSTPPSPRPTPVRVALPEPKVEVKADATPPAAAVKLGFDDETRIGPPPAFEAKPGFRDDETRIGPPPDVRFRKPSPPMATPPAPFASAPPAAPPGPSPARADAAVAKPKPSVRLTPVQIGIFALMIAVGSMFAIASSRKRVVAAPAASNAAAGANANAAGRSARTSASGGASAALTGTTAMASAGASSTGATSTATALPSGARPSGSVPLVPATTIVASEQTNAPATTASTPGVAQALSPASSGDERAAVLAVESGATERAARLYDGLAASHPDRPAYREAARILHAKSAP